MSARANGFCGMHTSAALQLERALFMPGVPNPTSAGSVPPLPKREDRGEGEGNVRQPNALPFFRTEDRITHLLYRAEQWRGTPWCANSAARGAGVACHMLPTMIYVECGALLENFPRITGNPNGCTANNEMELFLDHRPEFDRVPGSSLHSPQFLSAGDLIGLWLPMDAVGRRVKQRCVNHLGVCLGNGVFVHVLAHKHTDFDQHHVPPWCQRIIAAWRPLDRV